jgi:hypothetical protein
VFFLQLAPFSALHFQFIPSALAPRMHTQLHSRHVLLFVQIFLVVVSRAMTALSLCPAAVVRVVEVL